MTQKIQTISIAMLLIGGALTLILSLNAPKDFPVGSSFEVGENESLYSISNRLEEEHIITSALFFRGWISLLGQDTNIDLGKYTFDNKLPLGLVVAKFIRGPDQPLLSVTIPEGHTTLEIAQAFRKALPTLSVSIFTRLVTEKHLEGYLFPSTYYPLPSFTEEVIIERMNATFEKEYTKNFGNEAFPAAVPDRPSIISLAAILEGEAKNEKDMRMVSGILQTRLQKGMRLQVDVAEETYDQKGLPALPINNPGVIAIDAAFHPIRTEYLFYLTGTDGTMHYAKTFEEHKRNIQKYLR